MLILWNTNPIGMLSTLVRFMSSGARNIDAVCLWTASTDS